LRRRREAPGHRRDRAVGDRERRGERGRVRVSRHKGTRIFEAERRQHLVYRSHATSLLWTTVVVTLRAKPRSYGYGAGRRHRYRDLMADVVYIGPGGRERRERPLLRTLIGAALRRARLEQGRTLAEVAREARVSMPYLSEVERGRKEASSEVLAAVCDALRIDLADLLAATGRDLVEDNSSRASVVRLEAIRAARALVDQADTGGRPGRTGTSPASRPGDAVCLLAA